MTDYTNIVNDLLGINDTMFAISTSNINIDKISIRMAFDKNWHNIAEHAADAIEALQAEVQKRGEWVRVEDKLPDDGDWAIFTNGKVVTVERFKEDAYNHFFPASQWFDFEDAIAWMPLPEPPKEDA